MLEDNRIFSKVFMWMFIGLAITFGVGYCVSLNENMLYNVFSKYWIVLAIVELALVFVISLRINKIQPLTAKVLFCLYSFVTGLTFSSIFVVYNLTSIVYVFGITALIFLIFSLIGYYTKVDLTKFGVYLFMALLGIIICSLVNFFIGSETFDMVLTAVCLVVFIGYVAYDIQVIKRKLYMIENEDNLAIYGALQLYLDFINIFLRLLRYLGERNN